MTITHNEIAIGVPSFLELETTGKCQLRCTHCYNSSGPDGGTGTMTPDDWRNVIDQAAALGVASVQFIGGEPTLDPDMPGLARYALAAGLKVYVYSNLVHVTPGMWELFSMPDIALSTSYYAADPVMHGRIMGSQNSYVRTRSNIIEAVRRGIPVRVAVVKILPDQDTEQAETELRSLGVTDIRVRREQAVGRVARDGAPHDLSELCGNCGDDRAAVMPDGTMVPCVVGRWLGTGNVRTTPLAQILAGPEWERTLALVPRRDYCPPADDCPPASDGNDCPPASCQ
jgi:sulfatase maturation enzyme AslB (radical SAM superfamily)